MISIENITKKYNDKVVLNRINCTFEKGITAILGPNGAGKSTLINILMLIEKPNNGKIYFDKNDILPNSNSYLSICSYMPQLQSLYEDFTGYEFLMYIGLLKKVEKKIIIQRIKKYATKLDLFDEIDKKIKNYSGGMKQRLIFIASILNNPLILYLDEPTASLDPNQRIKLKNILSELALCTIIVITTHIVQDIDDISNSIIFLKEGNILNQCKREKIKDDFDAYVYEKISDASEMEELSEKYLISNVIKEGEQLKIRFITNEKLNLLTMMIPTVEDYYLWRMSK